MAVKVAKTLTALLVCINTYYATDPAAGTNVAGYTPNVWCRTLHSGSRLVEPAIWGRSYISSMPRLYEMVSQSRSFTNLNLP